MGVFQSVGGFLMVISSRGNLIFSTDSLTEHLGHNLVGTDSLAEHLGHNLIGTYSLTVHVGHSHVSHIYLSTK